MAALLEDEEAAAAVRAHFRPSEFIELDSESADGDEERAEEDDDYFDDVPLESLSEAQRKAVEMLRETLRLDSVPCRDDDFLDGRRDGRREVLLRPARADAALQAVAAAQVIHLRCAARGGDDGGELRRDRDARDAHVDRTAS
jgi:hypothetical protein